MANKITQVDGDRTICSGRDQSPIDINEAAIGTPAKIQFHYQPTPLVFANNGHTIQVNMAKGNGVNIYGEDYKLHQFHFHTPSEHITAGKASAMEATSSSPKYPRPVRRD